MRLERQSGCRPESLGLPEQLLVSEMDAIEISEGHGVPANRTVRLDDSLEEFHPKWVYPNRDSMGRVSLQPDPVGQEFVGRATPPDWTEVFGFDGPLELELGAGMGGFAIEYAAQFPNVRYVAFEWRKKFAREAHRRAAARGLKNIRFIEANARAEVPRLFTPGSLSVIHLQFPDPWWKRSHQKRSLVQADFSRLLYQLLAPGGLLDFRTDVEDRAHRMIAALEASGFVNPLGPGALHPRQADEIPSAREQRYLATGAPVYRAKLGKPSRSGPADRGP
jgi:tRNA (guanine-N7-)-methyltransferase